MIALFVAAIVVWVVWVTQSVLSIFLTARFSRSVKVSRIKNPQFTPHAAVIIPFKGLDLKLDRALESLATQDYPDYQLIFVVESESDAAYPVLKAFADNHTGAPVNILVAGPAGPNQGQKVHNQLCALATLWDTSKDEHIWVFADSDAVPGKSWLWHMVDPLAYIGKTGMTTGYRWLIPEMPETSGSHSGAGSGGGATIWSHLTSCMNSSCAVFLGKDEFNFAWGGSMAIRVALARKGDLRAMLQGALCDDYQFSRLVIAQGQRIYFVPKALSASSVDFSFASMTNFVHRQYLLTRVYVPHIYYPALLMLALYPVGLFSAWAALFYGLIAKNGLVAGLAGFAILTVMVCEQIRSSMRKVAIVALLGEATLDRLRPTLFYDRWFTPVWMILHFCLAFTALLGRTMTWRGIKYRLYGPQKVQRL